MCDEKKEKGREREMRGRGLNEEHLFCRLSVKFLSCFTFHELCAFDDSWSIKQNKLLPCVYPLYLMLSILPLP